MNDRERFLEIGRIGRPDRQFYAFYTVRLSTRLAWERQGLPADIDLDEFFGNDRLVSTNPCVNHHGVGFPPSFEEEYDDRKILITLPITDDPHGPAWRTMVFRPEFRLTPGFDTHQYIQAPVSDRRTFEIITRYYDADDPSRYSADWPEKCHEWRSRDYPIFSTLHGLFMQVREWTGFEGLCTLFADDPGLVHDMLDFAVEFNIKLWRWLFESVEVDWVLFDEDMAYKTASMISPEMFREFMAPAYRKIMKFLRGHGIPLVTAASDGYLGELIPLWQEVGFQGVTPLEVAAGNNAVAYRRQFPNLWMRGNIDKRELAKGKEEVRREVMSKVPYLYETGGYMAGVDHAIPPDVPVRNYLYMVELCKEIDQAMHRGSDPYQCESPGVLERELGPVEKMWQFEMNLEHGLGHV